MSGYPAVRSGRLIARMASSCMRRPPSGVSCPAGFSVCSVVWSAHSSPCSACFFCSDCSVCPDRSFSSISSIITESFLSSELAILNLPAALVRHMHLCGTRTYAAPASNPFASSGVLYWRHRSLYLYSESEPIRIIGRLMMARIDLIRLHSPPSLRRLWARVHVVCLVDSYSLRQQSSFPVHRRSRIKRRNLLSDVRSLRRIRCTIGLIICHSRLIKQPEIHVNARISGHPLRKQA